MKLSAKIKRVVTNQNSKFFLQERFKYEIRAKVPSVKVESIFVFPTQLAFAFFRAGLITCSLGQIDYSQSINKYNKTHLEEAVKSYYGLLELKGNKTYLAFWFA